MRHSMRNWQIVSAKAIYSDSEFEYTSIYLHILSKRRICRRFLSTFPDTADEEILHRSLVGTDSEMPQTALGTGLEKCHCDRPCQAASDSFNFDGWRPA